MTCFENFKQSATYGPATYMQTKKTYKAEHVEETLDANGWKYANPSHAIKDCLKKQNSMNGIAQKISGENLDTVLLQIA